MSLEKARADLAGFEQEAAQARQRLAKIEAQANKIRIYIEMAEVYGGASVAAPAPREVAQAATAPQQIRRPRARDGIVETARNAVAEFLRATRKPVQTRELLTYLTANGIQIGGKEPVSNLSGMLSKSPLFEHGHSGWSLAEWRNAPHGTESESPTADIHDDVTPNSESLEMATSE